MNVAYSHEHERRLRAAAIGCGGHATRNIFPTFVYAPVDFVAACDLDRDRVETCGRVFGAKALYTDHHEMLEKEKPDVVFIVTNYDAEWKPRYPKLAIDAMRAGAHAWIEKPPASSSAEIEEMIRVSRETGRFVGVGLKKMFFPANRKAKAIIGSPEFGGLTTITCRYPQHLPSVAERGDAWKMLGFLDHLCHPHSVLRYLAGPVDSIFVRRHAKGGAVSSIQFASGAVGSLHFSHGQSGYSFLERTEAVGEGANVVIDNNVRVTYYRRGGPEGTYGRAGNYFGPDDGAPLHWEPEFSLGQLYNKGLFLLGYAPEIIDFCQCALAGTPPAVGGLDDALEIMRIYEAYLEPDGREVAIRKGPVA